MAKYIDRDAFLAKMKRTDRYFMVRYDIEEMPTADVAEVRHGQWLHTKTHLWYRDEDGEIDTWRFNVGFHNGPECQICHETLCIHCHPDWQDDECEQGYYICSECGETSADGNKRFCPNCGAKMDGGADK